MHNIESAVRVGLRWDDDAGTWVVRPEDLIDRPLDFTDPDESGCDCVDETGSTSAEHDEAWNRSMGGELPTPEELLHLLRTGLAHPSPAAPAGTGTARIPGSWINTVDHRSIDSEVRIAFYRALSQMSEQLEQDLDLYGVEVTIAVRPVATLADLVGPTLGADGE